MWHDHWHGPRWLCQQSGMKNTDHSLDKPTNINPNQHQTTQFHTVHQKDVWPKHLYQKLSFRCGARRSGRGGCDTYKTAISMVVQLYQFATTIAGVAHGLFHNPGGDDYDEQSVELLL